MPSVPFRNDRKKVCRVDARNGARARVRGGVRVHGMGEHGGAAGCAPHRHAQGLTALRQGRTRRPPCSCAIAAFVRSTCPEGRPRFSGRFSGRGERGHVLKEAVIRANVRACQGVTSAPAGVTPLRMVGKGSV